jgi:co-chaperonin GroES (HSP10)
VKTVQPRNDRVLIRRIDEPEQRVGLIYVPQVAQKKAIKGEIIAVGPGRWIPGEWWKFYAPTVDDPDGCGHWEWIDGYFQVPVVKPGQFCYFGSRWDDSSGQIGSEYHLVQEADIFCIVPKDAKPATATVQELPDKISIDA